MHWVSSGRICFWAQCPCFGCACFRQFEVKECSGRQPWYGLRTAKARGSTFDSESFLIEWRTFRFEAWKCPSWNCAYRD